MIFVFYVSRVNSDFEIKQFSMQSHLVELTFCHVFMKIGTKIKFEVFVDDNATKNVSTFCLRIIS